MSDPESAFAEDGGADASGAAAETESLLSFLYQLPMAVVQARCDGAIELMNPAAASLLNRIATAPAAFNFFAYLAPFDGEVRRAVEAFSSDRGAILENHVVCTSGAPEEACHERPALSISVTRVAADRLMILFREATDEVLAQVELARQRQAIRSMATPIIEGWDQTLLLPIVGVVDGDRAELMTTSLLDAVVRTQARFVIVDFTGISHVAGSLVQHLDRLVRATTLLGCKCLLSGVSPELARTLAEVDVTLGDVETFLSVKEALAHVALGRRPRRGAGARPRG